MQYLRLAGKEPTAQRPWVTCTKLHSRFMDVQMHEPALPVPSAVLLSIVLCSLARMMIECMKISEWMSETLIMYCNVIGSHYKMRFKTYNHQRHNVLLYQECLQNQQEKGNPREKKDKVCKEIIQRRRNRNSQEIHALLLLDVFVVKTSKHSENDW